MSEINRVWVSNPEISKADRDLPVRQVYVWLLTKDDRMIVVSKDGIHWQLPGGKPEPGETLVATAVREVKEETGFDISPYEEDLECIGYYVVEEPLSDPSAYLQVRMRLNLPLDSDEIDLTVTYENKDQAREDVIRHAGAIGIREVGKYIPWMPPLTEYREATQIDKTPLNQ